MRVAPITILLFAILCASSVGAEGILETLADAAASVVNKMTGSSDQESDTAGIDDDISVEAVTDTDVRPVVLPANLTDDKLALPVNLTDAEEQTLVTEQTTDIQVKGDDDEPPSDDTATSDSKAEEAAEVSDPTSDMNTNVVNGQAENEADTSEATTESDKSLVEKGKSIISDIIDTVFGGDDDEETVASTEEPKGNRAIPFGTCDLLLCTDDVFQVSTSPKKAVLEENEGGTTVLTCQASFNEKSLKAVSAEMEWVFAPADGPTCSFGPKTKREYCDSALYSFNSEQFLLESAFVADLHLFNLSPSLAGVFTCFFNAPCCLANSTTVDTMTIEATSSLAVHTRPDYGSHLMLAFAITLSLCLAICLSLYVYFRMARKVRSNMPDLDKSGVKYKQMKVMTPPVITVDENMFYRIEDDENHDSYSNSANVHNTADA